jgi:hypothetical protein
VVVDGIAAAAAAGIGTPEYEMVDIAEIPVAHARFVVLENVAVAPAVVGPAVVVAAVAVADLVLAGSVAVEVVHPLVVH